MKRLKLEIIPDLNATDDPNAWMVYAEHPEGGCVTLFWGTRAECEEFVRTRGPKARVTDRPQLGGQP